MNVQIPVKWLQELLALCGPEDHELCERVMVSITAMDEQTARAVAMPEPAGCLVTVEGESHHLDANLECAELWVAEEQKNGAPYVFGYENLYTEQQVRALLATGVQAQPVPDGWREQFATEVYTDLEAADNQDVPLEEYPARILKVLDSIVGPRHPAVVQWRNDAIKTCIAIAYKYCRDPDSHKYLKQDLEALLTAEPAPQAQAVERGEVLVTVSGFTGSGKSAIAGEIEIMCRALGLQVEWPDSDSEKHVTHADWIAALEQYKPRVRIVECNVPHSVVKGQDK